MAKKRPVMVWIIRQRPKRDPKFHQAEMFDGVGRSIKEVLMILIIGWCLRVLSVIISFNS